MVLISLLGRGQKAIKGEYGYESVIYRCDHSKEKIETPYVGEAIAYFYRNQLTEIHIIGTRQAMWNLLLRHMTVDFESQPSLSPDSIILLKQWDEFVLENKGNPAIEQLETAASNFWRLPTRCHFIPAGIDRTQKHEIYQLLGALIKPGAEIALDITHGFRFQSMVVRDVILAECRAKNARLKHVFYGALEIPDPETGFRPVLDLVDVLGLEH